MTNSAQDRHPIKAVIFDLDGVLVSTDEFHYQSWQRMADEEGLAFDREFNEQFRGVSRMQCLDVLLQSAARACTDAEKQELAERKNRHFRELIGHLGPDDVLPGCRELICELKRRGVKVAVASGSKNAPFILERIGLGEMIDVSVSRHDITRSKPDPEAFLISAERLGVSAEECLVVEDAAVGIEAARRAGMRALGIGKRSLEGASLTVPSLAEVTAEQMLEI